MATEDLKMTFRIGGDMEVFRMGFGAMRICGSGVWGWPTDREETRDLLCAVLDLGINLIDTADAYGPETSEYMISDALAPYPDDLVVATKGGLVRGGPGDWKPDGRPDHLRRALANSLRRLELECIPLYQLHAVDPAVGIEASVETLAGAQQEGLIRHIGLSNVTVEQLEAALRIVPIATVQNRYNLRHRVHEPVLEFCEKHKIGFIPWYPLDTGNLAEEEDSVLSRIAADQDATTAQIALAWLLYRSPVMLPIPGTSSVEHLEDNFDAAELHLSTEEVEALSALGLDG